MKLILLLLLSSSLLWAQEKKPFRLWEDGLYFSFKHFQLNQPPSNLKPLQDSKFVLDNEENIVFLQGQRNFLDSLWGFCIEGQPYIKIESDTNKQDDYFVKLKILGRITYLDYPVWEIRPVNMAIYNPLTGKKIGEKQVLNKEKTLQKKLIFLETGEIKHFSRENIALGIAQDIGLSKSLQDLGENPSQEQLYKIIRIYNDRNPLPQ